jgi:hypothetical protein
MDALTAVLVVLSFLFLGAAILAAEFFVARRHLREVRIVRCPAVAQAAAVSLGAGRAAVDEALGRTPVLRIADCTRWPRAHGCDQACLEQIAGDPEEATLAYRVRAWIGEKSCSECGLRFEGADTDGIYLVSPLGTRFEWTELPPDWLAEAIETWTPLCAGCGQGSAASARSMKQ